MSKHTPGPWKIQQRTTALGIIGADGYAVAAVRAKYPRMQEHRSLRDANASLIAAAPEMYEALMLVWHKIRIYDDEIGQAISHAIAKAEGRS